MASQSNVPTDDYEESTQISVDFAVYFNTVTTIFWLSLTICAAGYAVIKRKCASRAWLIYTLCLLVMCLTVCQTASYLSYAYSVETGNTHNALYGLFLAFFNMARSAFLAVLLVISSGYCITRSSLGPYKSNVIGVPLTVLITGLVTDYTFFALQNSPDAKSYDLSEMTALAASLWFICSVLNLASLILAWMYTFEMLGKEIALLEEDQQAFQRRNKGGQRGSDSGSEPNSPSSLTGVSAAQRRDRRDHDAPVRNGRASTAGVQRSEDDPEVGAKDPNADETVADRLAYNTKRRLMSRFAKGVGIYLACNILVLMLPVFVNHVVQSTLLVLQ